MTWRANVNLCRIATLLTLAAMACAQTGEERVKPLLVMITAQWDDSAQNGAGIIVGHRQDRLYILTANHVVRSGPREAKSVVARLHGFTGETQAAKISEDFDTTLDLAVLIVPNASALGVATLPFGILGDSTKLERETGRVRAMGYPAGKPWFARPLLDVVSETTVESIRFDSPSMVQGYSGGGLFNHYWELVGMLRSDQPPEAEALRIERAIAWLRERKYPVQLATGNVRVNPTDGLTYVWIPPGRFVMGCSPGDSECEEDEKPAHPVEITRGFWMGQTEVTQAAYQRVMGSSRSIFKGDDFPVERVNWTEASNYCSKVGGRLPTEGEWEYAARGGTTGARYGVLDLIAWHSGNSGGHTHAAKTKQANAYGLYDVLGNVYEWTADWHGRYQAGEARNPEGPSDGRSRVMRGGGWNDDTRIARASYRRWDHPSQWYGILGFRCVWGGVK